MVRLKTENLSHSRDLKNRREMILDSIKVQKAIQLRITALGE